MVALVYAAAVAVSMLLANLTLDVSTIWLPAGVGLIAVLVWGHWLLPLIVLVHIAASFAIGDLSLLSRVGMGVIATSEIGVAAWLLCRGRAGTALTFDMGGMARFALVCLLLVPITGGLAAAGWLWGAGVLPGQSIPMFARNWWMAVALGMLCITPLMSSWLVHGVPRFHGRRQEALTVLVALAAPSVLILLYQISQQNAVEGVLYASLPILLWASIFLRETGAATALTVFTLLALGTNHLLPDQAVPIWNSAAHIVAFGLMALIIANAQSNLEKIVSTRARQAELEELAFQDTLTGLANRNRLHKTLVKAFLRSHQESAGFALLMIDLDGFKPVNDLQGHAAGDEVLRIIGARLKNSKRKNDLIARFGGDEFVAVLEGCPDTSQAKIIAERFMQAINQPITLQHHEQEVISISVGASIGVTHTEHGANSVETILKQADAALYQAKGDGKAQIVAYHPTKGCLPVGAQQEVLTKT